VFVKVCGITNEDDALLAVAMGADALGFIFSVESKRNVSVRTVRDIVSRLPTDVITVGVFRNESRQKVVDTVHDVGLRAAQLHGVESCEDSRWIRSMVPMTIKAFVIGEPAMNDFDDYGAELALVEGAKPGSGKVFDWSLAQNLPVRNRLLLAGGLDPDNVGDAIRRVRPFGVDVATGIESEPGQKDARKVTAFIKAAKAAGDEVRQSSYTAEDPPPFDWWNE